jgi:hypothetical protein
MMMVVMEAGDEVEVVNRFSFGPIGGRVHEVDEGTRGKVLRVMGDLASIDFEGVAEIPRVRVHARELIRLVEP